MLSVSLRVVASACISDSAMIVPPRDTNNAAEYADPEPKIM